MSSTFFRRAYTQRKKMHCLYLWHVLNALFIALFNSSEGKIHGFFPLNYTLLTLRTPPIRFYSVIEHLSILYVIFITDSFIILQRLNHLRYPDKGKITGADICNSLYEGLNSVQYWLTTTAAGLESLQHIPSESRLTRSVQQIAGIQQKHRLSREQSGIGTQQRVTRRATLHSYIWIC